MSQNSVQAEARRLWVEALRSGEYKQTKRVLTELDEKGDVVGHCCLGVACHLAVEAGVLSSDVVVRGDLIDYVDDVGREILLYEYKGNSTVLPEEVRDWLGLRTDIGSVPDPVDPDECKYTLVGLNDDGQTFEEIAAIIESAPPGLFEE